MEEKNEVELEDFFGKFSKFLFNKGELILRAGEMPAGVFYLKRGYVRQYALNQDGRELTLNIFKLGAYFPMVWAWGEVSNNYYFEAMGEVEVWRASKEEVVEFVRTDTERLSDFTRRILVGLGGLSARLTNLFFGSARGRVAMVLYLSGKRFGKTEEGKLVIQLPLTHQEIANQAGLTRETVSVEMKKMEKEGIIGHKGRLIAINDSEGLEEKCGACEEMREFVVD